MKRAYVVLAFLGAMSIGAQAAETASLTVKITGLSAKGGTLMIAVVAEQGLPRDGKALASRKLPAVAGDMTVNFDNLPAGELGVKVLQDLNGNGVMDTRLGIFPAEPYGFSNNPSLMGPPRWDAVKFQVKPGANLITIRMN